MILRGISIANFKAFGSRQRVPLRPITLIYGANSAGKSSILHALALAHHAVETGELDVHNTRIGGESIDLGGFRQYVHRRERDRQVELTFEIDRSGLSGHAATLLRPAEKIVVEVAVGAGYTGDQVTLFGERARELDPRGDARVERVSIEADGATILTMSARAGGVLRVDRLDHRHPIFRKVMRHVLMSGTTTREIREEDLDALSPVVDALVPGLRGNSVGLFPRMQEETVPLEGEMGEKLEPVPVRRGRRREDLGRVVGMFLPRAVRELVNGLGTALETQIRQLRYLGPLRSYPPRHLAFAGHEDSNWYVGGGYAWDVVRTRADIRERVNAWLSNPERLQTPYELEVRQMLPRLAVATALPTKVGKLLHDVAAMLIHRLQRGEVSELGLLAEAVSKRIDDLDHDDPDDVILEVEQLLASFVDPSEITEHWMEEMAESDSGILQEVVLVDKRNGTEVSHRDVGIGVSQVLPVLVSAFAHEGKLIAVEQPEIHLHPALQAELGDVFLESALGRSRNTLLIETHSEHLMLRILRRIRETADGERAAGTMEVRPEHVAVVYVQPTAGGAEIIHIPITEDGEFERPWPRGFFPERAKELF